MRPSLAIATLLFAACRGTHSSDDTGTSTVTTYDPAAEEACNDFLDALCATATSCDSDLTVQQCTADVRDQGLRCECAQAWDDPGLVTCIDELETIDCDTFAEENVPASCDGLFSLSCG